MNTPSDQRQFQMGAVEGIIARRILVNFRCDPAALQSVLPSPFRPKLISGSGIAGICLIRLQHIRPIGLPAWIGVASENAAHRVAVEWDEDGKVREGVFIPRRDTNSLFNVMSGGRLFPGFHHRATFLTSEADESFHVKMQSVDGSACVEVRARVVEKPPPGSVFPTLDSASNFFRNGSLGWSARGKLPGFDGLELRTVDWRMEALDVTLARSSLFEESGYFEPGSVVFDSAFLMRNVRHEWHSRGLFQRSP